jgi:hypothetical protein
MTIRLRSFLMVSLALGLCVASAMAAVDPEDAFTMKDLGNGRVEVVRPGHAAVVMNMAKKQDKNSISVEVKNPNSNEGGYFRYLERERRIETGGNGRQFIVQINDDGTVKIGNTVCDGKKDQACIATALGAMLDGLPIEGVIVMRHALNDALRAQGMPLGKEIRETFRDLVRDLMKRENGRRPSAH